MAVLTACLERRRHQFAGSKGVVKLNVTLSPVETGRGSEQDQAFGRRDDNGVEE